MGGLLLGAVIPFTVFVIVPTNKRLFEGSLDLNSPESATLLTRWGRLHTVRSAASLVPDLCLPPRPIAPRHVRLPQGRLKL